MTGENVPLAACASIGVNNDKVRANNRVNRQFMCSEIVGFNEYKNIPSNQRCFNCDDAISYHNKKRVAAGLREWKLEGE